MLTMKILGIKDECFGDYRKPSMLIAFPTCSFKCDKECGRAVCQNSALAQEQPIEVPVDYLIQRYLDNHLTQAVICGGLEPFDSWEDLQCFIMNFRMRSNHDIVIYTGYNANEIDPSIMDWLKLYAMDGRIIVKYGRFVPDCEPHYDGVLGIELASPNQYAEEVMV